MHLAATYLQHVRVGGSSLVSDMKFLIVGSPAPGGSKQVFPIWYGDGTCKLVWKGSRQWPLFRVVDDAGARNKRWKAVVACQAKAWMRGAPPFKCPLEVSFTFWLPRPKYHFRTGKFSHELKEDAPVHHIVKPDALKFARSTEDAMTGIVWEDDAQNVTISSCKRYMIPGENEGVTVAITRLE